MANLSRGKTFGSTETVTNVKLHDLIDFGNVSNIVDADCSSSMNLTDTKLADITTGNKVRGTALGNLASIPSGAGVIPSINVSPSLASIANQSLIPITLPSWVDGAAMRNIQSMPSLAGQLAWYSIVSSLASGGVPFYNGVDKFIGKGSISSIRLFTSSGVFVAETSMVFLTIQASGAGGGPGGVGTDGGGGAAGGAIIDYPYATIPGNSYTITINNAGGSNQDGGSAIFDSLTIPGGLKGLSGSAASNGGTGPGNFPTNAITTVGTSASLAILPGGNGYKANGSGVGGFGASSLFGIGGTPANGSVGGSATGYGAGGAGGSQTGQTAGGSGSKGFVLIKY